MTLFTQTLLIAIISLSCAFAHAAPASEPQANILLTNHPALQAAKLALDHHQPTQALSALASLPPNELSQATATLYHQLLAEAYRANHQLIASLQQRLQLAQILIDPIIKAANYHALWQTLQTLPATQRRALLQNAEPDTLTIWLELAQLLDSYRQDPSADRSALQLWQQQHPDHPGNMFLHQALTHNTPPPRQVALLLPLSGPRSQAGQTIRDGLLAAYYHLPHPPLQLHFYDTAQPTADIFALYQQAVNEGATFVIGPLTKQHCQRLATHRTALSIPTLALNYLPYSLANPGDRFFQFGISPLDEATQVAEKAREDGRTKALVIAPVGHWGDQVSTQFIQRWQSLQGLLLGTIRYTTAQRLDQQIRHALEIDTSTRRATHLARTLHRHLRYTPRPRHDLDLLFIIGSSAIAHQIKPLLKFYFADSLPIYATSMVYPGNYNPKRDRDINGVRFCDMPWILKPRTHLPLSRHIHAAWPQLAQRYPRLFAIGIDSFWLSQHFQSLLQHPQMGLPAESGALILHPDHTIGRRLQWALVRKGIPQLLSNVHH